MSGRLNGKTVIVTDAANGTGEAIAACVADAATQSFDADASAVWVAEECDRIVGLVNNVVVNVKYVPFDTADAEWDPCSLPTRAWRTALSPIGDVHGWRLW